MTSDHPHRDTPDKALALWMLDRMRDSEEFLGVIQAARRTGRPDVLDEPDYVARHKSRLAKLYQSDEDDEDTIDAPPSLAAKIDAVMRRDMISSVEELLEKALAAYIDNHPSKSEGLPKDWQTTFDVARAEIEGKTSGAFEPGFAANLAASARAEIDRSLEADQARESDGRES